MADKFVAASSIKAGTTSVSVVIQLLSVAAGGNGAAPITGIAHTDLTSASYLRQGGVRVAITLSALGSVDAAFSAGGWIELDATNLPGLYRLDVPDAALAVGADWVIITVADAATRVLAPTVYALPTFDSLRDAITDDIVETEGSVTLQQAISIILSVLAGRTTNSGLTFKTPNDAATRVTATTDVNRNRTSITLNPSA